MRALAVEPPGAENVFSLDSKFLYQGNSVVGSGDGGILVWRSRPVQTVAILLEISLDRPARILGGTGQFGNAVNVYLADYVIVANNKILQLHIQRNPFCRGKSWPNDR